MLPAMRPAPPLLLALLLLAAPPAADPEARAAACPRLLDRYEVLARVDLDVEEVGGMAPLASEDPAVLRFLAVSDEGRRAVDAPVVTGSLFVVSFRVGADGSVAPAAPSTGSTDAAAPRTAASRPCPAAPR